MLIGRLPSILPGVTLVSEEASRGSADDAADGDFIFVDPLDGTREFLAGRKEFTVNIGVVADRVPTIGVIVAPALQTIWRGAIGLGAQRIHFEPGAGIGRGRAPIAILTRPRAADAVVAMTSRSHFDPQTEAFLAARMVTKRLACGSSLKFCRIAEGQADLFARLAPTSQWDVATGHAVVVAAGGGVTTPDGRPLSYGPDSGGYGVPGFVAWGNVPLGGGPFNG